MGIPEQTQQSIPGKVNSYFWDEMTVLNYYASRKENISMFNCDTDLKIHLEP